MGSTSVLADLQYDAVQIHHRINRIQWAVLPFNHLLDHPVGNFRDQTGGDIRPIHFLERIDDLPGRQPLGIQKQNLIVHLGEPGLAFFDELRFKAGIPVSWRFNLNITVIALEPFTG